MRDTQETKAQQTTPETTYRSYTFVFDDKVHAVAEQEGEQQIELCLSERYDGKCCRAVVPGVYRVCGESLSGDTEEWGVDKYDAKKSEAAQFVSELLPRQRGKRRGK